jgi:hypothetical protein
MHFTEGKALVRQHRGLDPHALHRGQGPRTSASRARPSCTSRRARPRTSASRARPSCVPSRARPSRAASRARPSCSATANAACHLPARSSGHNVHEVHSMDLGLLVRPDACSLRSRIGAHTRLRRGASSEQNRINGSGVTRPVFRSAPAKAAWAARNTYRTHLHRAVERTKN